MSEFQSDVLVTERRSGKRRLHSSTDRRQPIEVSTQSEELPGGDRRMIADRRRLDRRRQIDPTTCERDYSTGEIEFMRAMDDYKRKSGRPFPTWSEVLEVVISLGYRQVADPTTMAWRTFGDSAAQS